MALRFSLVISILNRVGFRGFGGGLRWERGAFESGCLLNEMAVDLGFSWGRRDAGAGPCGGLFDLVDDVDIDVVGRSLVRSAERPRTRKTRRDG